MWGQALLRGVSLLGGHLWSAHGRAIPGYRRPLPQVHWSISTLGFAG
jgi:hypothetical protein